MRSLFPRVANSHPMLLGSKQQKATTFFWPPCFLRLLLRHKPSFGCLIILIMYPPNAGARPQERICLPQLTPLCLWSLGTTWCCPGQGHSKFYSSSGGALSSPSDLSSKVSASGDVIWDEGLLWEGILSGVSYAMHNKNDWQTKGKSMEKDVG